MIAFYALEISAWSLADPEMRELDGRQKNVKSQGRI